MSLNGQGFLLAGGMGPFCYLPPLLLMTSSVEQAPWFLLGKEMKSLMRPGW